MRTSKLSKANSEGSYDVLTFYLYFETITSSLGTPLGRVLKFHRQYEINDVRPLK